jgi:hypothetical protein
MVNSIAHRQDAEYARGLDNLLGDFGSRNSGK